MYKHLDIINYTNGDKEIWIDKKGNCEILKVQLKETVKIRRRFNSYLAKGETVNAVKIDHAICAILPNKMLCSLKPFEYTILRWS